MQRLLLLILVLNVHESPKLVLQICIFFIELGFEVFNYIESIFLRQQNSVFLIHEFGKFGLLRHHEADSITRSSDTCSSTDSVDIFLNMAGRIVLDNPIHRLKVKPSRGNIRCDEHSTFAFIESHVIDFSPFMFHVTMQFVNITTKSNSFLLIHSYSPV